jgi:hypothetical protein
MSDDALRAVWQSNPATGSPSRSALVAILEKDRALRDRERWTRIACVVILGVLCPVSIYCAAFGVTPLIRGAYALMGTGLAFGAAAEWMYLGWSGQAMPGARDMRSQLEKAAILLSRQASLIKTAPLWCGPVFLSVACIGVWIYEARSHSEAVGLWVLVGTAWAISSAIAYRKGRAVDSRRSQLEQILDELDR